MDSDEHISLDDQGSYDDLFRKELLPDGFAGLTRLKSLKIWNCETEECLANAPATTIVFPVLEELDFSSLRNLRQICRGPVPEGSFGKLTSIEIRRCNSLEYLFPLQILGCLTQLKRLAIQWCVSMKAVIWKEQRDTHIATNGIEFRNLEFLNLVYLPNLVGFCTGIDQIDFPKLRCMHLSDFSKRCFDIKSSLSSISEKNFDVGKQILDSPNASSIFPQKVTFPCLEDLSLESLDYSELQISPFLTVKKLVVSCCYNLRYVFNSSEARRLVHLKELNIHYCPEMDAVVDWEEEIEDGQERKVDTTLFPQLSKLQLNDLSNLRRLCRGPVPGGSFGELTSVEISDCNSLEYLFPLQIVGCLTQLERLTIQKCAKMKEVIWKEQGDAHIATNGIEFRNLEFLHLQSLPSLVSFYTWIDQIDFPKLRCIHLEDFSKRLFDIKSSLSSNSEQNFDVGKQTFDSPNASSIFPQKVTFPCLEDLILHWLHNWGDKYFSELLISSFPTVKKLEVSFFRGSGYVFHSSLAGHLVHLKELNISNCWDVEAVFGREEEIEDGQERKVDTTLFPQLRKLQLNNLLNLKRFCHFTHTLELPMLSELDIRGCHSMEEFSLGHVSTPNLSSPGISWNRVLNPDISWNGDLNNAIRLLQKVSKKRAKGFTGGLEAWMETLKQKFAEVEYKVGTDDDIHKPSEDSDEREKEEREKVERERFAGVEEDLQRRCRVANEDIHGHSLDSDEKREKEERERFAGVEEELQGRHRVANDDIQEHSLDSLQEHSLDSDETREKAERESFAGVEEELQGRRRVADDDIHEHSLDSDEKREKAERERFAGVEELQGRCRVAGGDIHEHSLDSDEMNSTISWRETLPPNPQRGRCICFRTADLYTDTSVITRFYSVPFDLFGDGGDDDASSSNPDVEGLEPFYKCIDFATTSTLSSVGSSLFVVGGSKETGPCRVSITTEKMYRFDTAAPENDWYKWVELSMQTPRAFPITVAMDGKLYIFGGSDPESPDAPLAELFDPESSTSVPLPLPSGFPINAWCHLVVAALQPSKKILVASGLSSDAYEYNVVDQGWEKLDYEVDFSSVQGQAAVVQNGNALCWCSNNVDEVHAYHLVHKRWFKSPIKGLDKVGMRDPDGLAHYCPIFPLDDNHLCLLWKDHMGYDGTNLPLLHCVKIQVSINPERSRFDAVVVASRTYALGPDESIFDAHVFLREDDEGGERGSGRGGLENGGRTWERSGYGGGKRTVSSIAPFKTCSKCWGTGHTESSCDQVGSGAGT